MALVGLTLIYLSGCRLLYRDEVVAKVGKNELRTSDLDGVAASLSGADSIRAINTFIDAWVKRQVKLHEAEKVLAAERADIEAMVENYRNSLLSNRLDQNYLENRTDTLITDSMVSGYFNSHRSEFVMDRTIVKGRIVRLPLNYRQSTKLFALMGAKDGDKQQDFHDLCAKNNFSLYEPEGWVDFSEFLSYLPARRDDSYDNLLSVGKIQQMTDNQNKYFIEISNVIRQGENAPYERAADMVKRLIFNRHRGQMIQSYEDSLYQAALLDGIITIKHFE